MSVLLSFSKLLKKADPHLFKITPVGTCNFEDSITSTKINPYELLNISNSRMKLVDNYEGYFQKYKQEVETLLKTHKTISYVDKQNPLSFEWDINNKLYKSTSLFFEYYMLNIMDATKQISLAITKQCKNTNQIFKNVKNNLVHVLAVLPEWKTQEFILPAVPYVVTSEFVKQLIHFSHASQAMALAYKEKNCNTVALNTAIHHYDKMWLRAPVYGAIAFNHLIISKALLNYELGKKENIDDNAEKKYALFKEAKELYNCVSLKNCFVSETIKDMDINNLTDPEIKNLETVYYTTGEYDISEIPSLRVVPLKLCKETGKFGCKCSDDKI